MSNLEQLHCTTCESVLEKLDNGKLKCPHCGNEYDYPEKDEVSLEFVGQLNEANGRRVHGHFDEALERYDDLIGSYPDEVFPYWGAFLSDYGIEYVGEGGAYKPICHRITRQPATGSRYLTKMFELCSPAERESYMRKVDEIEWIRRQTYDISKAQDPYDVYICHGKGKRECETAEALYGALSGKRVFMEEHVSFGANINREAYIFPAIESAKCMFVIAEDTASLNETENELSLLPFISSGELKPLECPHLKLVHRSERFFAYRALPQDGAGEGHFVCVLRKTSGGEKKPKLVAYGDRVKNIGELSRLAASLTIVTMYSEPRMRNDGVYLCPLLPPMSGLCVVRLGVQLASPIKNGFIPSHSFVAAMKKDTAQDPLNFRLGIDAERQAVERYLMGDTVSSAPEIRGFKAVAVDSFPLGLVKASGGEAKNHYPKGLRNLART